MCQHNDNNQPELHSHKRLGADLDLFDFSEVSPGCAFWLPHGMRIWNALSQLWRELNEQEGYLEVRSPIVYDAALWEESGHWEKYQDHMFAFELDDRQWGLKPMNCPGHIEIYRSRPRSYRELPLRLSEQGQVHRYEQSGAVNGLLRARSFSIDDAHLFCREQQVEEEVGRVLALAGQVYRLFGLELRAELSLRPDERYGDNALWDAAEESLRRALGNADIDYQEQPGGGAFYGPKIDLHMQDSLGRDWQLGSVQLDYVMPRERFQLDYIDESGQERVGKESDLVIVHRAIFGSFERFIAILLEHFDGQLPLWCAPRPLVLLPLGQGEEGYANEICAELQQAGVQAEIDSNGSLGKRIRRSAELRVPLALIVGPSEREARSVMMRHRSGDQQEISKREAVAFLAAAVKQRRLVL